jgi:hypothetical protein
LVGAVVLVDELLLFGHVQVGPLLALCVVVVAAAPRSDCGGDTQASL